MYISIYIYIHMYMFILSLVHHMTPKSTTKCQRSSNSYLHIYRRTYLHRHLLQYIFVEFICICIYIFIFAYNWPEMGCIPA